MTYDTLQKHALNKVPPFNEEAEQAILGALLLQPSCLRDVQAVVSHEDFYRESHRLIFDACRQIITQADPRAELDLITLRDALERQPGALDKIGGAAYLVALADAIPTAANVTQHAAIVREAAILRRLLNQSMDLALSIYQRADSAANLIRAAKETIDGLFRQTFQGADVFWTQDAAGIATEIDKDRYLEWLFQQMGFAMLDINDTTVFVRRQANIVALNKWVKSTNKSLKKEVKAYCRALRRPDVWALFLKQNDLFSYATLTGLDTLEHAFVRDAADTCRLYFTNGIVEITAASVAFRPYRTLQGYLWDEMIAPHAYTGRYHQDWLAVLRRDLHQAMKAKQTARVNVLRRVIAAGQHWQYDRGPLDAAALETLTRQMIDDAGDRYAIFERCKHEAGQADEYAEMDILQSVLDRLTPQKSEYQEFLEYVASDSFENANGSTTHVNNLAGFEFALAYLIHQHNNPANMRVVILADSNPSFVSNGRRGKKIIFDALRHVRGKRSVIKEDGKAFDGGRFKFQRVQPNTRIIILDDVSEDFDFRMLFSCVTDGLVYEGKNVKAGAFDFEDTPKFGITTNHPCFEDGMSSSERTVLLPVSDYFTKIGRTPFQVFGHLLFDDWDADEWDRFFDYMIAIIQRYLQRPDPSVVPVIDLTIFNANKLLLKVPEPMVNFLDALPRDKDHEFEDIKLSLEELGVKFRTTQEFTKALHTYCKLRSVRMKSNMKDGRLMYNGKRYVHLTPTTPELYDAAYKKPQIKV